MQMTTVIINDQFVFCYEQVRIFRKPKNTYVYVNTSIF